MCMTDFEIVMIVLSSITLVLALIKAITGNRQ